MSATWIRTFAGLAVIVVTVAADGVGQNPAVRPTPASRPFAGRLTGIYDDRTGAPIDGAEVRDMGTGSFALTTSTGTLSLFFVDTAGGLLRIRKGGYKALTVFVDNSPGDPPLTLTLEPIAQELPTVVTRDSVKQYSSPGLREFEERRKLGGGGRFVSEATIRAEEDRPLGNIIKAHVPGLDVLQNVRVGSRTATIAVSTRSGKQCEVDVYLDGIPISLRSTATGKRAIPQAGRAGQPPPRDGDQASSIPTNDLSDFFPKDLAGVEYYSAATVPVQFNRTASGCGTLLLWTRER